MAQLGTQSLGDFTLGEISKTALSESTSAFAGSSQSDSTSSSVSQSLITNAASVSTTDSSVTADSLSEASVSLVSNSSLFSDSTTSSESGVLSAASLGVSSATDSVSSITVSGDVSTLAPSTVLAACANTLAVGGETVRLNGISISTSASTETTSESITSVSNVSPLKPLAISETLSGSNLSRLRAITNESLSLAESIGGLIAELKAQSVFSDSTTGSTSDSRKYLIDAIPSEDPPLTETIGSGGKSLASHITATSNPFSSSISDSSITPFTTSAQLDNSTSFSSGGSIATSVGSSIISGGQAASFGGNVQSVNSLGSVGSATTTVSVDGDVTAMVPATVLAATADTVAVGGETLSLKLNPFSENSTTQTNSLASISNASSSGVLSDSISSSIGSSSVSSLVSSTIESISTSSTSSKTLPSTLFVGSNQGSAFNTTTAICPPFLPKSELGELELGTFLLGENGGRANQSIGASPKLPDPEAKSTSISDVTSSAVDTNFAPSLSASIGGFISSVQAQIFSAQVQTETTSTGTLPILANANVSISDPDTETTGIGSIIGSSVLTLLADSEASVFSVVPQVTNSLATESPATGFAEANPIVDPTIANTDQFIGIPFTTTTAIGLNAKPIYDPLIVDPDTITTGIVPIFTKASLNPLLSPSISQANGEVPNPTLLTGIPFEAIRYLPDWAISPGPRVIQTTTQETRTFDEMTLEFAADKELLIGNVRPQIQNSGKLEIVPDTEGGFDAVDLASGTNRIELFPPTDHADVRPVEDWLIVGFEEQPLGTAAGYYNVELVVAPDKEKAYDNEYGTLDAKIEETRQGNEWLFEFNFGDVATRRVTSDVDKTREGAIDTAEITLILTAEETRIVEESVSKLNAVKEIDVPDGDGSIRDTNSELRNTVNVTVPDVASDTLQSGEYVVTEWETVWKRGLSHEVTLTLKK